MQRKRTNQEDLSSLALKLVKIETIKTQPIFSTDDFIFDKVSQEMSAEASALGDMFGNAFQVKSDKTGKIVTFVHSIDKRDADGNVLWFEFIPACPADAPRVKRVIIFND